MVYYKNLQNQQVYGYDPITQQGLINQAIANGWEHVPVWPLPPGDEQLIAQCKQIASSLLFQTDWAATSDVADAANTPRLINQAEFIAYRKTVRNYAINPVPNPVWPAKPVAQWSSP